MLLRPLKSRILFEQIIGRGTRKGERFPDKSHFTVFDCFDGTLLRYFKEATGITQETPAPPSRTIAEIVDDIWRNHEREYNTGCLVKRLHRLDRQLGAEARETFSAWVPDGDLSRYARGLPQALRADFVGAMRMLRDPAFQDLLVNYPRPPRTFYRAIDQADTVTSVWIARDSAGNEYRPGDYLEAFSRFVEENEAHVEAIGILLDRPRDWSAAALSELDRKLRTSRHGFTVERLQRAHELHHRKALCDIISMVKHAAHEEQPLLSAAERTERALLRIRGDEPFTEEQERWLERIRQVMVQNLSIDRADFDDQAALSGAGGWGAARRSFGEERLGALLRRLNEAIAA